MKSDFEKRMAIVGSDYVGPAGPIPLERLLRKYHQLLVDLRAGGLTWEQISRLLAGVGVLHRDGQAFLPSHLRGVYGRQRKRLQEKRAAKPSRRTQPFPNTGSLSSPATLSDNQPIASTQAVANPPTAAALTSTPALQDADEMRLGNGYTATAIGAMNESLPGQDRNRVLAMIRQAALARRST